MCATIQKNNSLNLFASQRYEFFYKENENRIETKSFEDKRWADPVGYKVSAGINRLCIRIRNSLSIHLNAKTFQLPRDGTYFFLLQMNKICYYISNIIFTHLYNYSCIHPHFVVTHLKQKNNGIVNNFMWIKPTKTTIHGLRKRAA